MADKDTNTNTNTNTNKHIKIGVLICFAPPLRRCVAIATPRLRSPAASHHHSCHKYYVDSSGVSASECNRGAALAAERCKE